MKTEEMKKTIGLDVKAPAKSCSDPKCPFHGSLSVHGRTFTGKVLSDKMSRTVSVGWDRTVYIPKYERYEKKRSKVKAHSPDCLGIKKEDTVRIMQCRPLSKTKHFVIVEKVE